MIEVTYDTWLPYTEYEKHECDIKLKDGTILRHAWPNAGKFHGICDNQFEVHESEVAEIMYSSIHQKGCDFKCNTPDVIVVGSGADGRATARAAAEKGLNVVVVDGPPMRKPAPAINIMPEYRDYTKKHKCCSYRQDGEKWVCACRKELK